MTNREWRDTDDPKPLLELVRKRRDRKMRLAAVAACQLFFDSLTDERSRCALHTAERFADDKATEEQREEAWTNADAAYHEITDAVHAAVMSTGASFEDTDELGASTAAWAVCNAISRQPDETFFVLSNFDGYEFFIADIIRDVFGPVTGVRFDPTWLTADVTALANSIYEGKAFAGMSILADALEEAGCTDMTILEHCRFQDPRHGGLMLPHVRGCWVLDLVLGRA